MSQKVIDFINEQERVYIVETKEMVLDSENYDIGYEVLGFSNKGVIFKWMDTFGIEKWNDIENYSLVSIVDLDVDDYKKVICVFNCKTLESIKTDLVIY